MEGQEVASISMRNEDLREAGDRRDQRYPYSWEHPNMRAIRVNYLVSGGKS